MTTNVEHELNGRDTQHYRDFYEQVSKRLEGKVLYLVNASKEEFWETYLRSFPKEQRQYYNCNCCKGFITKYGRMVYFDPSTKRLVPAVWNFGENEVISALYTALKSKLGLEADISIASVSDGECGSLEAGSWNHYAFNYKAGDHAPVYTHITNKKVRDQFAYYNEWGLTVAKIQAFVESVKGTAGLPANIVNSAITLGEFWSEYTTLLEGEKHQLVKRDIEWHLVGKYNWWLYHFAGSALGAAFKAFAEDSLPAAMVVLQSYTDDLKYRRPVKETDEDQMRVSAEFLKENGWLESLNLRPAGWNDLDRLYTEKDYLYTRQEQVAPPEESADASALLDSLLEEKKEKPKDETIDAVGEQNIRIEEFLELVRGGEYSFIETPAQRFVSIYRKLPDGCKIPFKLSEGENLFGICFVNQIAGTQVPTFTLDEFGVKAAADNWVAIDRLVYDRSGTKPRLFILFKGSVTPTEQLLGYIPTEELVPELYPHRRAILEIGQRLKPKPATEPVVGWDVVPNNGNVGSKIYFRIVRNGVRQVYCVVL